MQDTIDHILEKLGKLELQIHYLEEAAIGEHINVGFKRLSDTAKTPTKAHKEDAGWDLYSDSATVLRYGVPTLVSTGIAFEMPAYHHGLIWDRSSMGKKGIHILGGLIDNPYTGEIGIVLINLNREQEAVSIDVGSKITQIVFTKLPITYLQEKDELGTTSRGAKGFGSSGI